MSKRKKEINHDLIEQLIKERKMRKLTQKELATIVGCPQPSISRIENRTISPTLETVEKICEAMGLSIYIDKLFK